jgi:predicted RNA polymerase sigma factor
LHSPFEAGVIGSSVRYRSTPLEEWPQSGVPENPGGWLAAIDLSRRNALAEPRARLMRLGQTLLLYIEG